VSCKANGNWLSAAISYGECSPSGRGDPKGSFANQSGENDVQQAVHAQILQDLSAFGIVAQSRNFSFSDIP
jgi:hypothetical protein